MEEVRVTLKDTRFLNGIKDHTNRFGYFYCIHLSDLGGNYLCTTNGIQVMAVKTSIDIGIYAKITNIRLALIERSSQILTDITSEFERSFSDEYQYMNLDGLQIDKNAIDILAHNNLGEIPCAYEMLAPEFPDDLIQLRSTIDRDKASHCISLQMIQCAYKNELFILKAPKVNDNPWLFSDTGEVRLMLAMPMRLH